MEESDFEGSAVLEQLAAVGEVDGFFEAIDSDDLVRVKALLRLARVDASEIEIVLRKIRESDPEH
jgi:hypothetical protein